MLRTNKTESNELHFETLEPRNMLAATVYVDFGIGFDAQGGFQINDTDSASLGGPQVFGTGTTLTSYGMELEEAFVNDDLFDLQNFIDDVVLELNYFFEPFDISVQIVQSSSLSAIAGQLQSTSTNDAYIHLGGLASVSTAPNYGAAVLDSGNSIDNLAFVFTDHFIYKGYGQHTAASVGANIARQAAVTFGVMTTEGSDAAATGNVMSIAGTDSNGDFTTDTESLRSWDFVRADLGLTMVNGVSPGQQNSFDTLATAVGRRPGSPEYFTSTGAKDQIAIDFLDDNTVDFTINGQTWANVYVGNGMLLRTSPEAASFADRPDEISLIRQRFDVLVQGDEAFITDNVKIVNRNAFADIHLVLDNFDDTVIVYDNEFSFSFDTAGGDDVITHDSDRDNGLIVGDGDDRIIILSNHFDISDIDGGTGYDILHLATPTNLHLWDAQADGFVFGQIAGVFTYMYRRFQEVVGPVTFLRGTSNAEPVPILNRFLKAVVDGPDITITDETANHTLIANDAFGVIGQEVQVLATAHHIVVRADYAQISSNMDWTQGTTENMEHNITVMASEVLVSNMDGTGKIVKLRSRRSPFTAQVEIKGLIGGTLYVAPYFQLPTTVAIHGSDTESDRFDFLTENATTLSYITEINTFGHGGDDAYIFGSNLSQRSGWLDFLPTRGNAVLKAIGGPGFDYLYLNDEGSDEPNSYELSDSLIRNATNVPNSSDSNFRIEHEETEHVRLDANTEINRFFVDPSPNVIFHVGGGDPGPGDGDSLKLVGNLSETRYHVVQEGPNNGVWYFGNAPGADALVIFKSVEQIAESGRLAVGSQAGIRPLVSVFNSYTNELLFNIQPYSTNFTGGVQVETADINRDSIPDIIVAPGKGRYSLVQVYDGRTGFRISSFFAFKADGATFQENYTGGVDIAIGDVFGDNGYEIIASTLKGTPDVRTFAETSPLSFDLIQAYNPFPDSFPVGARVATGEFTGFGKDEVVVTAGPGWQGLVGIYAHFNFGPSATLLKRFFGYVPGYLGGFTVDTGDINGDQISEIFLGAVNTGSANDPFSGQYRVLDGASLPVIEDQGVIPLDTVQVFSRLDTRSVSVTTRDLDLNGVIDHIFAAQRNQTNDRRIVVYDPNGIFLDRFFATAISFENGMELG